MCIYCQREIDPNKEGYSLVKNQNGINAWHYTCFERDHTEVIIVSHKTKVSLAKFLLNSASRGNFEPWMGKVLEASGYHYEQV
jgi:hypothetical protein